MGSDGTDNKMRLTLGSAVRGGKFMGTRRAELEGTGTGEGEWPLRRVEEGRGEGKTEKMTEKVVEEDSSKGSIA